MSTTSMEDVFKAGYEAGQNDIHDGRGEVNEAWEEYRYNQLLKAGGKQVADEWLTTRKKPVDASLQNLKCPDCGGQMLPRSGQFGKFWGCKRYPSCTGTRNSEGLSKAERQAERSKEDNSLNKTELIDVPVESGELYKFKKG